MGSKDVMAMGMDPVCIQIEKIRVSFHWACYEDGLRLLSMRYCFEVLKLSSSLRSPKFRIVLDQSGNLLNLDEYQTLVGGS